MNIIFLSYSMSLYEKYHIQDIFYADEKLYIIRTPEPTGLVIFADCRTDAFQSIKEGHIEIYWQLCAYTEFVTLQINDDVILENVHFYPCLKNKTVMSTLVKNEDNYIEQWIKYHKHVGVDTFIIYDNKMSHVNFMTNITHDDIRINPPCTDLKIVLKSYIEDGSVILLDWPYPYCVESGCGGAQISQQNHSLYAFRQAKYIGFMDVDEFVNPQGFSTIQEVFDKTIIDDGLKMEDIGAFELDNRWFYNPDNLNTEGYEFLKIADCDDITWKGYGHEKSFVVPANVTTFSVHHISTGKRQIGINSSMMFFNHYCYLNKKERGRLQRNQRDSSILKHLSFLNTKYVFLTFGGGNQDYTEAVDRIVSQARSIDLFDGDEIYGFKEADLRADQYFWEKHGNFIEANPRGFGYWIWKPYLIKKMLNKANEGDVILYCDSGNELDVRQKNKIKDVMDGAKHDLIIGQYPSPTRTPFLDEVKWNKSDLLNHFGVTESDVHILYTNQRQANPVVICKSKKTELFVNEWYETCCHYAFITDEPSRIPNSLDFLEHRHDQSVFSLLTKKYELFSETRTTEGIILCGRNRSGRSLININ